MSRYNPLVLVTLSLAFVFTACKDKEPPVAPAAPPPAPVPVAEPVVEEDTVPEEPELPPTEEPVETPTTKTAGISKNSLIGNYSCAVTSDQFPMGLTPPAATCKIYQGSGENLKIGPIGKTGINGSIVNIKGNRFTVTGSYNVGIGELKVNARLTKRNAKTYKGKGSGSLGSTGAAISYTLTLKKK